MSGIEPSPELYALFNDMKLRSKFKYAVFSLSPGGSDSAGKKVWTYAINATLPGTGGATGQPAGQGTASTPEPTGRIPVVGTATPQAPGSSAGGISSASAEENAAAWKDMVAGLPQDTGRFVLFDWRAKARDGRLLAKVILVKWCPDVVDVQTKMLMGSSYGKLKEVFTGLGRDLQAADPQDLDLATVSALVGQA